MNNIHYDAWKRSHQIETSDFDIADAVMEQITRKACKKSSLRSVPDLLLSNLIQPGVCVRICVVAFGAVAGVVRMMFVAYYALFAQ